MVAPRRIHCYFQLIVSLIYLINSRMFNSGDLSLLPPEVIEEILSYCQRSDFFQLRFVSKSIRTFVNSSSKFEDALADVKIELDSSTLEAFVKTAPPLPFSNFQIITNGKEYFYLETPSLGIFMKSFCPRIRKLSVDHMSCCTWPDELEFFLCLRNLRDLCIIKLIPSRCKYIKSLGVIEQLWFPGRNRSIKRLSVEYEWDCEKYLNDLIRKCASLEFLKIPTSLEKKPGASGNANDDCIPYILRIEAIGHLQHLRTLDLNSKTIPRDLLDEKNFQFFDWMVANKRFRLMNVNPGFVTGVRDAVGLETFENFKQRIVSFKGMSDLLKADDLGNLEELSIGFNDWVSMESEWTMDSRIINLPALKKITVEISDARRFTTIRRNSIQRLFNQRRLSVSQLRINYTRSDRAPTHHLKIAPEYLDESLPNLTHLYVKSDRFSAGELERLVRVICRKEFLEELTLSTSAGIPVGAFLGHNFPIHVDFAGLKRLKKFALKTNLDWHARDERKEECRKMDDRMLHLLSRMSLTYLYIAGLGWDGVTCAGIEGLTKGAFGKSVLGVRLACVESTPRPKSQQGKRKYSKVLERLDRVAHGNRVSKGLTSTSFCEYKASLGNEYPLTNRDTWMDELIKW